MGTLADSLLQPDIQRWLDPHVCASAALLLGRVMEAARIEAGVAVATVGTELPASVAPTARALLVYAAAGGPVDSLDVMERRIDSLLTVALPAAERARAQEMALAQAAMVALPSSAFRLLRSRTFPSETVLGAEAAWARGDTAEAMRSLQAARKTHDAWGPGTATMDAAFPEAWMLFEAGDVVSARDWIDPVLAALRVSGPLANPVNAAVLVRAMALRADIANRLGDHATARRWAQAVAILWLHADEALQPLARRMDALAHSRDNPHP